MNLEDYRKNKGLTYDELSAHLKIKRGTVYNICRGVGDITLKSARGIMEKTHGAVAYEDLLKTNVK